MITYTKLNSEYVYCTQGSFRGRVFSIPVTNFFCDALNIILKKNDLSSLVSPYGSDYPSGVVAQNKTSLLLICTHTVISKVEHRTKSQWRYNQNVHSVFRPENSLRDPVRTGLICDPPLAKSEKFFSWWSCHITLVPFRLWDKHSNNQLWPFLTWSLKLFSGQKISVRFLQDSPCQERSNDGLKIVVALQVRSGIDFFVCVHWGANPAVDVAPKKCRLSLLRAIQLEDRAI